MVSRVMTQRAAVLSAMNEFDELSRETFLAKYGYGKAKAYFVEHDGKQYDSKAIYGVAFGFEHPDSGPLKNSDFSGGEYQVAKLLRKLDFKVERSRGLKERQKATSALVLASQEETSGGEYDHWKDVMGVQYHFPTSTAIWSSRASHSRTTEACVVEAVREACLSISGSDALVRCGATRKCSRRELGTSDGTVRSNNLRNSENRFLGRTTTRPSRTSRRTSFAMAFERSRSQRFAGFSSVQVARYRQHHQGRCRTWMR